MPKTFETTRIWLNEIPNQSFQAIDKDVLCHWDGGSNSNLFRDKKYFFVLQDIETKVTQVSGTQATVTGIGIVFIHINKTDMIAPLYPAYYAPEFPQNTIIPTAIKHYKNSGVLKAKL